MIIVQRTAAIALTLAIVLPSSLRAIADEQTPKNIDEGIAKLEKLLGEFKPKDARQFRMTIESERENRPEEDKPTVLIVSKGEVVIGNPYRTGGAVSFDMLESIKRTIYELGDGDKRKIVRRQQRYLAARYSLGPGDGDAWEFDAVMIAHSIPKVVGRPYMKGTVKWIPNGIQLLGIGTDSAYAAEGRLIPVANYGRIKITRNGEELSIDDEWQDYHLGTAPDGTALPFPDFKRPIGTPGKWLTGKGSRE